MKNCRALWSVALMALCFSLSSSAEDKTDPKKDEPRKGTVTGIVVAKSKDVAPPGLPWIAVKADGEEKARNYYPEWVNGGPEKTIVALIKDTPLQARVQIEWYYAERPRIKKIEILKKPETK